MIFVNVIIIIIAIVMVFKFMVVSNLFDVTNIYTYSYLLLLLQSSLGLLIYVHLPFKILGYRLIAGIYH